MAERLVAGVPAYERQTYLEDIRRLRGRGLTMEAVARNLGLSRATVYRIMAGSKAPEKPPPDDD